ncbi:HAF repeat-containing protein, partial [Massilia sp. SYSU DXS3249]
MQAHQRVSLFLLSLSLPLGLGLAQAAPAAYPEYRVTIVAPAGSAATDINQSGVVVGTYPFRPTVTHGFLNRGKGLVDLGTLGGRSSEAVAINDKGEVLGNWTTTGGQQRGSLYAHGKQRDIGVIPGRFTTYTDINNAGYATAIGFGAGFSGARPLLRAPKGKLNHKPNHPLDETTQTLA